MKIGCFKFHTARPIYILHIVVGIPAIGICGLPILAIYVLSLGYIDGIECLDKITNWTFDF